MDASDAPLDPVVLSGWPSCTNCLSWSSDGELAIAVGEYVHILTPKRASISDSKLGQAVIGLRQWDSTRIRTNVFEQQEWPDQILAPSHNFSLGEEQSVSTVVGLAWSPAGIGLHRRNVLAVLTSNHVLSLWESNGTVGDWTRVLVVNHPLDEYIRNRDEAGENVKREKRRIRAFAWSPLYRSIEGENYRLLTSKWGVLHLAVANDDEDVIIFRVSKLRKGSSMDWSMKIVDHIKLPAVSDGSPVLQRGSLFHKAMTRKHPVLSLSWSNLEGPSSESFIQVAQYRRKCSIKVQPSFQLIQRDFNQSLEDILVLTANLMEDLKQDGNHDAPEGTAPENAELDKKVEEARLESDSNHSLDGHLIVRKWGQASHGVQDAVCITIHPSDMVEYAIPSMEKCTLVFAARTNPNGSAKPTGESPTPSSPRDVRLTVAGWILSAADDTPPNMPVDRQLLGIFATYAARSSDERLQQRAQSAFARFRDIFNRLPDREDSDVVEVPPVESANASDVETCLICRSRIPFDENNLETVRCESGHQYSK